MPPILGKTIMSSYPTVQATSTNISLINHQQNYLQTPFKPLNTSTTTTTTSTATIIPSTIPTLNLTPLDSLDIENMSDILAQKDQDAFIRLEQFAKKYIS
jgi:hypothetical protein